MRKSEKPLFEFFPMSRNWSKLWIPNLAWMSLIEYNWMLKNPSVTVFTVFELLRQIELNV